MRRDPQLHRVDSSVKIEGPYLHRSRYRCRVVTPSGRRWCPAGNTPQQAVRIAEKALALAIRQGGTLVSEAIENYLIYQQQEKQNRPGTIRTSRTVLLRFFETVLSMQMVRLTSPRCAALYDRMRQQPSPRTGKPIATDSHRSYLGQSQSFIAWCAGQGLIRESPIAGVRPTGRKRKGKPQLTIDEAKQLYFTSLKEAGKGDEGASAVLIALLMGLRAGEVVSRSVRDLDNGGRLLRVDDNESIGFKPKTEASRRPVDVPAVLQPLLRNLTKGKLPGALLFVGPGGSPWRVDWVRLETIRLCGLAGVRPVCAHSLRGFHATAAVASGASPHLVAAALGHESPAITMSAYAAPGTLAQADRQRVSSLLDS